MKSLKEIIDLYSKEYDQKFKLDEEILKSSNRVTIMETQKKQLNKTFFINEKGEIDVKATFPLYFSLSEVAINDIESFAYLTAFYSNEQDKCFTRAKPTLYSEYAKYYKNCRVKKRTTETIKEDGRVISPTLVDAPKRWLMIDVDYFETNYDLRIKENRVRAVNEFISTMPSCFHNVSCCVQYSNGMLVRDNNTLKSHIFFMTENPVYSEQLRPWIVKRAKNADPCTFNTAQIYFTAKPFFRDIEDPLLEQSRVLHLKKNKKEISLPLKQIKEDYIYNMLSKQFKEKQENIL